MKSADEKHVAAVEQWKSHCANPQHKKEVEARVKGSESDMSHDEKQSRIAHTASVKSAPPIIADGAPFTFVMDFKWSSSGFGTWMRILNTLQGSDIGFCEHRTARFCCWCAANKPPGP